MNKICGRLRPVGIMRVMALCFAVVWVGGIDLLAEDRLESVMIRGVPHVRQKPDFCGEACAEMWLRKLGVSLDQDDVFDEAKLDPLLGRGCYTPELAKALKRIGFQTGEVFAVMPVRTAGPSLDKAFAALHADLVKGVPSIVCTRFDEHPKTTEHFRLVLGYDAKSDEVVYHDPALDEGDGLRMKRAQFLKLWPLKYAEDKWTLVRMRLDAPKPIAGRVAGAGVALDEAPGFREDAPTPATRSKRSGEFTDADYAQHILSLKKRLPHEGFAIVIQRPFVVVGDDPADVVQRHAEKTVKWAVTHLKKVYFTKDPKEILDVWLFRDAPGYEEHVKTLTGRKPTTPYGFYSSRDKALFMNIATGGGTLVHEIVHPFIESNFPSCPSWFNEGLASLYEQSDERNGRIIGRTNWRLKGLQTAINRDDVPAFETLCSTTTSQFYNRDPGTNYSQARYLCFYLQEKNLLDKYYHAFRKNAATDPTGYQTLKTILGEDDMAEWQERWQAEVLKLRFP